MQNRDVWCRKAENNHYVREAFLSSYRHQHHFWLLLYWLSTPAACPCPPGQKDAALRPNGRHPQENLRGHLSILQALTHLGHLGKFIDQFRKRSHQPGNVSFAEGVLEIVLRNHRQETIDNNRHSYHQTPKFEL